MRALKRIASAAVVVAALVIPSAASADVVRSGNTFTATPAYCSCWSTIDGYVFNGIPYSDYIRDSFLGLPASTPVVVAGDNTGIWDILSKDPSYMSLPPVTSGSVDTTVSGTVGEPPAKTSRHARH